MAEEALKVQKIYCGFFRAGVRACERKQYSVFLLRDLEVTSLTIVGGPQLLIGGWAPTVYLRYSMRLHKDSKLRKKTCHRFEGC